MKENVKRDRDLVQFGQQLQKIRMGKGLTQSEAAARIGKDQGYYNRIECGHHNLAYKNILKIARRLGVSLEELFKGIK